MLLEAHGYNENKLTDALWRTQITDRTISSSKTSIGYSLTASCAHQFATGILASALITRGAPFAMKPAYILLAIAVFGIGARAAGASTVQDYDSLVSSKLIEERWRGSSSWLSIALPGSFDVRASNLTITFPILQP